MTLRRDWHVFAMSSLSTVHPRSVKQVAGFTLVELLVVIAIIGILASILLPTLSRARARAQGAYCLNNTKQLIVAWIGYAEDHDGRLPHNLVGGTRLQKLPGSPSMDANWANNVLDWLPTNSDNTNDAKLIASGIGPYTGGAAAVYRCPADTILDPSQAAIGWTGRVRSYSMNAMVGDAGAFTQTGVNSNNPDYVQFLKAQMIRRPAAIFVFLDEHPDSIDDGYFLVRSHQREWFDLPASYHNRGASFSFADGHAEIRRWVNSTTVRPARPEGAMPLPIPILAGEWVNGEYVKAKYNRKDFIDFYWVVTHMSEQQEDYASPLY